MLTAALATFPPDIQEQATKVVDDQQPEKTAEAQITAESQTTAGAASPLQDDPAQDKAAEPKSEPKKSLEVDKVDQPKTPPPSKTSLITSIFTVGGIITDQEAKETRVLTVTRIVTVTARGRQEPASIDV